MRFRAGFVLLAALVPASYALLAACSGDDDDTSTKTTTGAGDSGADTGTINNEPDTGTTTNDNDSGTITTGDDDAGTTMNFVALNSLVSVQSSIQLCFAASAGTPGLSDALAMNPQPTTPLAPGLLSDISVPSVVGQNVRVFTYYTSSLTALNLTSATCAQLLAQSTLSPAGDAGATDASASTTGVLLQTVDFDVSDVIPSSVFNATSKYLILPTGCPASSNLTALGDPAYCGDPGDASVGPGFGDFHVYALQLDSSHGATGTARVQGVLGTPSPEYQGFPPFQLGFTYTDSGAPPDGSAPGSILQGPTVDGYPSFALPTSSAALPTGTDVPALTGASDAYFYIVPPAGFLEPFPMSQVLSTSNLTSADLSGTSFTLVLVGDGALNPTLADGGPNPLIGMRLIRNDTR